MKWPVIRSCFFTILSLFFFGLSTAEALTMLVYGPTAGGYADFIPGYTVTVWSAATWATKTTADFAAFNVIVFEDHPECGASDALWSTADATNSVWGPPIT